MDDLQKCALQFKKLLNTEYNCILGKKNKLHNITISFSSYDFHHLAGLQYINNPILFKNRDRIFKDILAGKIKLKTFEKYEGYDRVCDRIHYLSEIEKFMDSNDLVFKYEKDRTKTNPSAVYSKIRADYLLKNISEDEIWLYFFLVKNNEKLNGISFFADRNKDYSKGQEKLTLLYKEKVNIITGEKTVQLDRLTLKKELPKKLSLKERVNKARAKQEAQRVETSLFPKKEKQFEPER